MVNIIKVNLFFVLFLFINQSGRSQCLTTPYSLCSNESYTLTAQTGLSSIQWQVDKGDGNGYVNIAGATNVTYVVTAIGKYKYIGTDANACPIELCCIYEVITGTNCTSPCPTTPYSLCANESYTLTAQTGLSSIQWQVDKGDGNGYVNIAGATNVTYVVTAIGKYKYIGTDANACPIELCCIYEVITGTNCTSPCPTTPYGLCPNESYTLTAQTGLSSIQWQVDKGDGNGYVNIAGATNVTYVVTAIGKYKYIGTDANACPIELCCIYEVITGTNCTSPCPTTPYSLCPNESYTLTAQTGLSSIQWQVDKGDGNGYVNIDGATNVSYVVSFSGMFRYTANDINGCSIVQCCPYNIQMLPSLSFALSLVPTCKGELDNILIENLNNTVFSKIKIDNGIFENYPQSSTLSGLSVGLHTITIQNQLGCTEAKQITINPALPKQCSSISVTKKQK